MEAAAKEPENLQQEFETLTGSEDRNRSPLPAEGLSELVREMLKREASLAVKTSEMEKLSKEFADAKNAVIQEMQLGQIQAITVDGTVVALDKTIHPNILAADRPKLIPWLKETGRGGIVRIPAPVEEVNTNTLNATIREAIENGDELPSWIRIFEKFDVKTRKKKK